MNKTPMCVHMYVYLSIYIYISYIDTSLLNPSHQTSMSNICENKADAIGFTECSTQCATIFIPFVFFILLYFTHLIWSEKTCNWPA